jgi:hypothetical protein
MISNHRESDKNLLCLLFIFEALLFWAFYNREVAWCPPTNSDQAANFVSTYRLQEDVLAHGSGKFWKAIWNSQNPTGVAIPIEGAIAGIIMGGTRFPQLCVNYFLFLVLQAVAFYTARTVWDSRFCGYMLVGLILCEATAWCEAGGLFDFRIDFMAYCLYGVWACTVLRSNLFLDRRWALGSGVIAAFLVLHRFLALAYLLSVCAGFAFLCAIFAFLARSDAALMGRLRQRLKNLGLSCAALIVLVAPILLLNSKAIWNYYVVGHILNEEKYIRASEGSAYDLIGHLQYYPRSIINDHLGQSFFLALTIAIAGSVVTSWLHKKRKPESIFSNQEILGLEFGFLLCVIVGPILILTADIAKSPVVGGIAGVPFALLVVVLVNAVVPTQNEFASQPSGKLLAGSAMLVLGLGIFNQISKGCRHRPEFADRAPLSQLTNLNQWLVNYAREYGWKNPTVSLDLISSSLNSATITATGFEKTGELLEFRGLLGCSIFGETREKALEFLENSNFVILTSPHQSGKYPFSQAIAAYWSDLKAWADKHLILARRLEFDNYYPAALTVYTQPTAQLRDISGDWITSKGVLIEAKRSDLERFPVIRLKGAAAFSNLPKVPAVTANLEPPDGSPPIPAIFHQLDNRYEIELNTSSTRIPAQELVRIRVKFDTFFVRKDAALHNDYRELVVRSPDVSLRLADR